MLRHDVQAKPVLGPPVCLVDYRQQSAQARTPQKTCLVHTSYTSSSKYQSRKRKQQVWRPLKRTLHQPSIDNTTTVRKGGARSNDTSIIILRACRAYISLRYNTLRTYLLPRAASSPGCLVCVCVCSRMFFVLIPFFVLYSSFSTPKLPPYVVVTQIQGPKAGSSAPSSLYARCVPCIIFITRRAQHFLPSSALRMNSYNFVADPM